MDLERFNEIVADGDELSRHLQESQPDLLYPRLPDKIHHRIKPVPAGKLQDVVRRIIVCYPERLLRSHFLCLAQRLLTDVNGRHPRPKGPGYLNGMKTQSSGTNNGERLLRLNPHLRCQGAVG